MFPPRQSFQQRSAGIAQQQQGAAPDEQAMLNQDQPMGDPIDTIAQMLSLDLTSATNPDQQGQMVVSAVEALVKKLHELTGAPEADQQQMGDEQEVDPETGEPYEDDQQEVDPETGEPVEQDSEEYAEDETDPEEDQYEEEEPEEEEQMPARRPAPRRGFAASFDTQQNHSPRALSLAANGRNAQIENLAADGFITPPTMKKLKAQYCTAESISLSLSLEDGEPDDFDNVVSLIKSNGRVVRFGEMSHDQAGLSRLGTNGMLLDMSDEELTTDSNPLVAAAERRAETVKKQRAVRH